MEVGKENLVALSQEDPEWNYMFRAFNDPVMHNKEYGEVLQYMGTVITPKAKKDFLGETIVNILDYEARHEFRHRAVPGTNERKYWHIPASLDFRLRLEENNVKLR